MQTQLIEAIRTTAEGQAADTILRKCVHCGFCNATCPTYQLLGDERDGPRGRIYLIKQALEGAPVSRLTQRHLDRCLTCLNCETTCPSGVAYGELVDIGRGFVEQRVRRPLGERLARRLLRLGLPYPNRMAVGLRAARLIRPLLPASWALQLPKSHEAAPSWPRPRHARRMLILDGCVQSVMAPSINAAAAHLFDSLGISLIRAPQAGCCGAVSHHLNAPREAQRFMTRNIDAWWPHLEDGAEAIIATASGCGAMLKDYGRLLKHDPGYARKAEKVAGYARDLSEALTDGKVLADGEVLADITLKPLPDAPRRIAFHSPCTLQHTQRLKGRVEAILTRAGFELTPVQDAHLCCGAAGTYALLQPELSQRLLSDKLSHLERPAPDLIATANIGCLNHLASQAKTPVRHWIHLFARAGT